MINLNISKDVFLPAYYPYLFDYTNRYEVYYGGRGSGKTFFIIQKLLLKGLKEKRQILLMQKRNNAVKDTVYKELLLAIDRFQLSPYFTFNRTEYRATCTINGTEFRCLGLDEPEKIKGYAGVSDVYLDEATAFTQDDFELIDGTLRSRIYKLPLQLICSFNPVSKLNWVYSYFGFATNTVPPQTFILKTTYLDNPRADIAQRMENLRLRNPTRYKIEALGEFATLDKLVYNNWTTAPVNPTSYSTLPLLVGLDFGFTNDPSALVASFVDEENKRLYIFREWGNVGKTNPELASIITSLGFAKSTIIADSAEEKSIEELRRLGIRRIRASVKGKDSIIHGIQRLQQYEIVVDPDCEKVIEELENYSWEKDKLTGEYTNKPVDMFNHYLDALRYSLQCLDANQLKVMDKSILGL